MSKLGIKVKFGKQCRRFRISDDMKLSEFQGRLEALFSAKLYNTVTKYLDADKDWVNIDTEEEFTEAKLLTLKTDEKCLRLKITKENVDFKKGGKQTDLEKYILSAIENSGNNELDTKKLKDLYAAVLKDLSKKDVKKGTKDGLTKFLKELGSLVSEVALFSGSSYEISNQLKQEFTVDVNKSNGSVNVYKGKPKENSPVQQKPVVKKPEKKVLGAAQVGEGGVTGDTEVEQETTYKKVWKVKNTGDCPWPEGTHLKFIGGSDLAPQNAKFQIPKLANVGEVVDVELELTAPVNPDHYSAYFSLSTSKDKLFGQKLLLELLVVENKAMKKWETQLKFLADMGFVDAKKLVVILEKNNGDLPSTIQDFLSQN